MGDDEIYGGEVFGIFGNCLSILATGTMLIVLGRDKQARYQVRPRILMMLAGLDFASAVLFLVSDIPGINNGTDRLEENVFGWTLGFFFQYASWNWTAAIGWHIYYVLRVNPEPNGAEEKMMEKRYLIFLFVSMVMIYLPGILLILFVVNDASDDDSVDPSHQEKTTLSVCHACWNNFETAFLVVDWFFICSIVIAIHLVKLDSADEQITRGRKKYKQQMQWFLVVYLLASFQYLVALILWEKNPGLYAAGWGIYMRHIKHRNNNHT
jgi:hypothetical protein